MLSLIPSIIPRRSTARDAGPRILSQRIGWLIIPKRPRSLQSRTGAYPQHAMATDSLKVVRISSAGQLEELIRERDRHATIRVEFRLSNVATEQVMRWEADVNRLLQECGCALAAKCVTCMTLIFAAIGVRNMLAHSLHWPAFLLYGCLSIVGAAIAAKFTAKFAARVRLRRIVAELRELDLPAVPSITMSSR
jgi:hypothetical protein